MFNSFSFLLLIIMASVFVESVVATRIQVSPFCRTARRTRILCNSMINGATNWHDAIGNAINATLSQAKELQSKNELIAPAVANLSPAAKKSLQGTCEESFQNIIDMLQEGQDALAAGDIATLQTKLSAALDTECNDELTGASPNADVRAVYDSFYLLVPVKNAVCTKNDGNDYCAASIAPGSSSQVTAGSVASMYQGTSLAYLFIDPTASKDVVCTPCTKNVLSAYTSFETSTPYALGLANSAILGGQQAIWQGVLNTCGSSFFAATGTGNAASGNGGGPNMGASALGNSNGASSTTAPIAAFALVAGTLLLAL